MHQKPDSEVELLESLARSTWERLTLGHELNCAQSEETLTDLILLELARARLPYLLIYKATKIEEGQRGFDWEWWVGEDGVGWTRYSIQAKKLNPRSGRYSSLRQKVRGEFQLDVLEDFSNRQHSIPLYIFYNAVSEEDAKRCWNCYQPFEARQFGCTVAPLDIVRAAHEARAPKSFVAIHKNKRVIAWRCLLTCEGGHSPFPLFGIGNSAEDLSPMFRYYRSIPREVARLTHSGEHYSSNLGGVPRRIAIIDTSLLPE